MGWKVEVVEGQAFIHVEFTGETLNLWKVNPPKTRPFFQP